MIEEEDVKDEEEVIKPGEYFFPSLNYQNSNNKKRIKRRQPVFLQRSSPVPDLNLLPENENTSKINTKFSLVKKKKPILESTNTKLSSSYKQESSPFETRNNFYQKENKKKLSKSMRVIFI